MLSFQNQIKEGEPRLRTGGIYRILFLEDNPDDVELMQHELSEAQVTFVSKRIDKKLDFLSSVVEFTPDVILADYSLSSFNGVQAFHMLKNEGIVVPFILVTGVLSEKLALECLKEGIDDFVLKSSFKRLPAAISSAIRKKEMEQEQKRMALELQKSHRELTMLLDRYQFSVEEERINIARDLHDELGQALTALKIDVMMLWKKFSGGKTPESVTVNEEFSGIVRVVDQITRSVKEISAGLRPETLDELGILEAIRWQAIEFEKRNGISCAVTLPNDGLSIPDGLSIALFRIVQEALTNVARHSFASDVAICLSIEEGELFLSIEDNGKGISADQIRSSESLGIIGLRERVKLLQGEFNIGEGINGGVKVSAAIPLTDKQVPV